MKTPTIKRVKTINCVIIADGSPDEVIVPINRSTEEARSIMKISVFNAWIDVLADNSEMRQ